MKRIGIYGGSFNPIHLGHLHLANWICQHQDIDEVWFLVSPLNPFKKQATDLLDDEARLRLTEAAVTGYPHLKVCDLEFHLERPSYMYKTLEVLRHRYPDDSFLLIIGADNWTAFDRWAHPEEILKHHELLVYPRTGYPVYPEKLPPQVHLIDAPLYPISSTELRQAIAAGKDASYGLPQQTWNMIKEKGYYRKPNI